VQTTKYWEKLKGKFHIKRSAVTPPSLLPHIHDAYEFMLILSHGVTCEINNQPCSTPPGTMLLVNNMDLHKIITPDNGPYDRYVLYFEPEFVAHLATMQVQLLECFYCRPYDNPWVIPLNREQCLLVQSLMDRMLLTQNESADAYGHELLLQTQLAELLIFVNRIYREQHGIRNHPQESYPFFEILNYIHEHLGEKLTVEVLSKEFCISRKGISDLFHKTTGSSVGDYVTRCRLSRATDALMQGMRVETVCDMVGFQNLSHFSRTFKKYMGLSPKQYVTKHLQ